MKNFCVRENNRLQLKVCEGCGALWLRPAEQGAYCRPCAEWLADMPVVMATLRGGRPLPTRRGSGPGLQKVARPKAAKPKPAVPAAPRRKRLKPCPVLLAARNAAR